MTVLSKPPSAVAGLGGWWKADGTLWQDSARTTAATADAAPVGAWDDASGNSRNVTQTTSTKRPLLKLNVLNGLPAVRFDGTDDFLSGGNILGIGTTSLSIFVVGKQTGDGAYVAKAQQAAVAGRYAFYRNATDGGLVTLYSPTTSAVVAAFADTSTSYRVISAVIDRTAGTAKNYISGTVGANGTFTPESTDRGFSTRFLLGAYNNSNDTGEAILLNGDIAEVAVFQSAIGTQDRAALHSYFADKYALSISDHVAFPPLVDMTRMAIRSASVF